MEVEGQGFGKRNSIMLLSEIEAIGKALCLDNKPSKSLISSTPGRSRSVTKTQYPNPKSKPRDEEGLQKDKKSIWSWKPLKAFSRKRRFKCSFYVHVHSIEGLPSGFNGASFRVHWKRQDGELVTGAAKVSWGVAEFEERLVHITSIHGSRNGPNRSAMYQGKQCLLYAKMVSLPELGLGKHRVDLTRLLPLTFEELEGDKSSGKWGTSYKLSGKAAGAVMNVSFGYSLIADRVPSPKQSIPDLLNSPRQGDESSTMRRSESLPNVRSQETSGSSKPVENVKDLHVVMPTPKSDLASSVITLYKKFDEDKPSSETTTFTNPVEPVNPDTPTPMDSSIENGCEDSFEFSVIERGIELPSSSSSKAREEKTEEVTSEAESSAREADVDDHEQQDENSKANELCTKESIMKELESALKNVTSLEEDLESLGSLEDDEEEDTDIESDDEIRRDGKSLSFNDVTESEFLKMLGIEDSPTSSGSESERHKDTHASASSPFAVETDDEDIGVCVQDASSGSSSEILADTFGFPSMTHTADEMGIPEANSNSTRAKALEDQETEALMCEYGFNENAFQFSPQKSSDRFGSSVGSTIDEPVESLPPLGGGLGPFLQTKGGGFVRTMNPSLFRNNVKGAGSLIMQVSAPVVVPAEMGTGIMEILQRLASAGVEKLSMQASKLMPLEDITGKTIQQVAREGMPALERHERQCGLSGIRRNKYNPSSEYISLEDLAPLAMDKMEALSIEGLRIQSGMSSDEEPSSISSKPPLREVSSFQNKGSIRNTRGSIGLGVAVGLQLLDVREGGEDNADDGLMGLSLTLDEWMRLDSGEMGDEDEISERTTKILAAHRATKIHRQSKGEKRRGERKHGLLGNNFTVALMVQLRDPLRNYEPVGAPMLSLVQVERLQETHSSISTTEIREAKEGEEEAVPQFKITQVHVAGLKAEPGKKKVWGSSNQQQSGSRWLLANGMGKNNKSPFLKSRIVSKSPSNPAMTMVQPGESLWSISSRAHSTHIRNPNVIFRSETIRLG